MSNLKLSVTSAELVKDAGNLELTPPNQDYLQEQSSLAHSNETKQSMLSHAVVTSPRKHQARQLGLRDIYQLISLSDYGTQPVMPCENLVSLKLIARHQDGKFSITEKGSVYLDAILEVKMPKPKWGY